MEPLGIKENDTMFTSDDLIRRDDFLKLESLASVFMHIKKKLPDKVKLQESKDIVLVGWSRADMNNYIMIVT